METKSQLRPATFAEFEQETKRGNVIAVSRTFASATIDPIDAFVKVADSARFAFLFESVEGGAAVANYSFLGANPYLTVRGHGEQTIVERDGGIDFQRSDGVRYGGGIGACVGERADQHVAADSGEGVEIGS